MKTQDELKKHYRDVIIPMVAKYNYDHGTDVKPWECVKHDGDTVSSVGHPTFGLDFGSYTFALTILEGRPVFVGDKVHYKVSGDQFDWDNWNDADILEMDEFCTFTPPPKKRTFMLGDKELPCPDKNKGGYQISLISSRHFFSDFHDAQKVANAIDAILTEARDKEE